MEKKSELMKALKELTEKRLLSNEVEALFEPYKDVVFPLSLSFVSSERSLGSQKDATYNEGYKVICNAENWDVEVAILFAPEDNTLVESYDSGQDFEADVRFIDYDSLYQRAIFGKLGSKLDLSEEEEVLPSQSEETASPSLEETISPSSEESMIPAEESSAIDPEIKAPEVAQQSADENEEVWNWKPDDDQDKEKIVTHEVLDSEPVQSGPDLVQVPLPSTEEVHSNEDEYEDEGYLYESETAQVKQDSPQPIGCSKGCMERVSVAFYVMGGLLVFVGCQVRGSGDVAVFGLVLIGIGYAVQKASKDKGYINK
ncbi:MAG: hypothetical protein VYC63_05500 [Verrucomicrobiota bacterium]|nr:hypothetical protein [Verrucomicrobiota bacterium]